MSDPSSYNFDEDGYRLLFLDWLKEWKTEAATVQSKIQYTYANAIKSLKNYPLPVHSGHGCIKLSFFGDHTCKKLDKKLTSYLKEHKLQRLAGPDPFTVPTSSTSSDNIRKGAKKKFSSKPTGSDDVVTFDAPETSNDVQAKEKPKRAPRKKPTKSRSGDPELNGEPATDPSPRTHSGGHVASTSTSVEVLEPASAPDAPLRSRCIITTGSTTVLTLGGGGGFIARTASTSEMADRIPQQSVAARFKNIPYDEYTMQPGTFSVVLCVDNQEIHGKGNICTKLDVIAELKKHDLDFDVRGLKVGDFLWIAREKAEFANGRKPRELVLDFIAERKRGDDLAISIKDGRYTCQKFRMKMAGLRRLIYIIEDSQRFQHKGLKDGAFDQALTNLGVQDGFIVKETDSLRKTAEYLLSMTMYLQRNYTTKTLRSVPFSERCAKSEEEFNVNQPVHGLLTYVAFSAVAKTNQTKNVSQAFLLQLLALDGVSPAKASAIVTKYPTLRRLLKAYDTLTTDDEKKIMLRDIKFGSGLTSIGPAISKRLYKLYCTSGPLR